MIAWIDVETTGLDPKSDRLLEVGVVLTDDDLRELDARSFVIEGGPGLRDSMTKVVLTMHVASGLLFECESSSAQSCHSVESRLVAWLRGYDGPLVMAGSTVGFDRAWLKAKMPTLERLFHYRSIDVSSLKELNRRWEFAEPWDGDRKIHRALPDLKDSIAELRHYRGAIFT